MSTTKRTTFSAAVAAFALACCLAIVALAAAPSEAHAVNPPSKPTIASVKPYSKTKLTVNVKSVLDVMGYQVKYSPYKSFSSAKTVTTSSQKTAIRISSLKAHKKYYVKVRAYRLKGSTKVWGKWSEVKYGTTYQYSITYKLNGGTWGKVTPRYGFNKSSATFTLKTPKRAGYDFKGWYTSTAYKTKVTKIAKGTTKSKTLYAKWSKTPIKYEVKYGEYGYGAYATYTGTATSLTVPRTLGGYLVVSFDCHETPVAKLDVSACTGLKNLNVFFCNIKTLDVSKCTALKELSCKWNNMTSLNVTGCKNLKMLSCEENNLKSLNVSTNTELTYLRCSGNPLTSLDITRCSYLEDLTCSYTDITSLVLIPEDEDVPCCPNLASLDVQYCTQLKELYCNGIGLDSLFVQDCTALTSLDCSENDLSWLEIKGCDSLESLRCDGNRLSVLVFGYSPKLSYINCAYNPDLEGFDVSQCPKMMDSSVGDIMCDATCIVTGCAPGVIENP